MPVLVAGVLLVIHALLLSSCGTYPRSAYVAALSCCRDMDRGAKPQGIAMRVGCISRKRAHFLSQFSPAGFSRSISAFCAFHDLLAIAVSLNTNTRGRWLHIRLSDSEIKYRLCVPISLV